MNAVDSSELLAYLEKKDSEILDLMEELTSRPALGPENGGDGELDKALFLQKFLSGLGFACRRLDAPDPRAREGIRPNLAAWLPAGHSLDQRTCPRIWVISHLDVVPPGDLSLWTGDPWKLRVEGDVLRGRGVNDNHHGLVASVQALRALRDLAITPAGQVGLLLVADEENGSHYGLEYVLDNYPELFSPQDMVVIPDVGRADGGFVEVSEKSMLWLRVEVLGRQVHASMPQDGVNALYVAARMMVAVKDIRERFSQKNEIFHPPCNTMEPTRKEAGVSNINTVPGRDVFYIDCRVLPGIDLREVLAAFREVFGRIAEEEGAAVTVEPVQYLQAPAGTDPQAPVVRALARAVKEVRGITLQAGGVGGGTVAAFFRKKKLPAVVWYTDHGQAHVPDEWTLLSDIIKDAQVFALLFSGHGRSQNIRASHNQLK